MISLDLEDVRPGMILAKPLYNFQGELLVREGTLLTAKQIWILRSWGVRPVWIEGDSEEAEPKDLAPEAETRDAVWHALRENFIEPVDHEVMVEIMRVASKRLQQRRMRRNANGPR